jgi:hypothetical protein
LWPAKSGAAGLNPPSAIVDDFRSTYTGGMRARLIAAWVAVTVVLILMAVSDQLFGKSDLRRLGERILLALVWPLAILSPAGRSRLFRMGRNP